MHIGVDVTWLPKDRRGMGRFVHSVLTELLELPEDLTFTLISRQPDDAPTLKALLGSRRHDWRFISWKQVEDLRADVSWFPWNRVDVEPGGPRVVTIHDTAAFDWPVGGILGWLDNRRAQQRLRTAVTRAARVMTVSRFSRDCIADHLGVRADHIDVVCEGEDFSRRLALAVPTPLPPPASEPFVLFVGAPDRRKNLDGLLRAWSLLGREAGGNGRVRGHVLRVVGTSEREGRALAPTCSGVTFESELDDDGLMALYRTCALFVMPSHYEGFGLPLLEAMACGAPVAAARAASLPEVGGDVPAWFDPGDASDMAHAIRRVLEDPLAAARMRLEGPVRAGLFTWRKAASQVLESLRGARVQAHTCRAGDAPRSRPPAPPAVGP